jgi:hypothetical protein
MTNVSGPEKAFKKRRKVISENFKNTELTTSVNVCSRYWPKLQLRSQLSKCLADQYFNLSIKISACQSKLQLVDQNYNLSITISTCRSQFQLVDQNYNLSITISTCRSQFQLVDQNFSLLIIITTCRSKILLVNQMFYFVGQH